GVHVRAGRFRVRRRRGHPRVLERRARPRPLDRDPGAAAARPQRLSLAACLGEGRRARRRAVAGLASRRRLSRTEVVMSGSGSVVIVGGTRAIGLELARHYASGGNDVVISGRSDEHMAAALDELTRAGGTVRGLTFDLAQPEGIAPALK